MAQIDDIVRSFTDEQKKIYDVMLGDENKLRADWMGCRAQYSKAMEVIGAKDTGPEIRLFLRNISDYWDRRRKAMERLLERAGKADLITKWKEELKNAKG